MSDSRKFRIASERALNTMICCASRSRQPHGQLGPIKEYDSANGEHVSLRRPQINEKYEDITQNDLDILRAVNTQYVHEQLKFKWAKNDPAELISEPGLKIVDEADLLNLWNDGKATSISITPRKIREWLKRTKSQLPTAAIEKSLNKLAALYIKEGTYKVRSPQKTLDVPVEGNLLSFLQGNTGRRSSHYEILFATRWGRLYIHNLNYGNLVWIKEPKYWELSEGAKNILHIVTAFKKGKDSFFKRNEEALLKLLSINIGKNKSRAVRTLRNYLDELIRSDFIQCQDSNKSGETIYSIEYLINPIDSGYAEEQIEENSLSLQQESELEDEPSPEEIEFMNRGDYDPLKSVNPDVEEKYKEILRQLRTKEQTTEVEVTIDVITSVQLLRSIEALGKQGLEDAIKVELKRNWHHYSPYFLFAVKWFTYYLKQTNPLRAKSLEDEYFSVIRINPLLQKRITDTLQEVCRDYDIPVQILISE